LELLYASPHLARSLRLLLAVLLGLVWAKVGGCRVVYTVHNLDPHEQVFPLLNRIANRTVFALADAVHVHDEEARRSTVRAYRRRDRIYVIPHGSYVGAYLNNCTKQEARGLLNLAQDAFVYLFLGQVRRYKGIEDLVVAFSQLASESTELVIAGNLHDVAYGEQLTLLTRGRAAIHTWFQYVPDSEIQYFMNACDVCVLPYREVVTSGAAVLAFSFGRPIIAPALGGFSELAADGRGIVYSPVADDGLLQALQQARFEDMAEAGRRALAWAREHTWQALGPKFARIYADVLTAGK
jgi:glycosyltransferase involved in cell wall biosynthesis